MPDTLGLYLHIPFCEKGKCPYCDFYSVPYEEQTAKAYTGALLAAAAGFSASAAGLRVDTVYFGGGTPSLLGERLAVLLRDLRSCFNIAPDAEITLEANPASVKENVLLKLRETGFNRLSLGMQSACPAELKALGRRHSPEDTARTVQAARNAGFTNISLDLMLATPGQTIDSLRSSVGFAASLGAEHLSAYLLKLEPGTPYYAGRETLALPDDDGQAEFYLAAVAAMREKGYEQYEISNFSKPGFASRHNLKYWNCDPYLGLGPGAHSFFGGRRFHYDRDLPAFLGGTAPQDDGPGGDFEEYAMLRLRLAEGLRFGETEKRFGKDCPGFDPKTLDTLQKAGYLNRSEEGIRLTETGFLVSNAVIAQLLYRL